jgi:hypothetical protein
MEEKGGDRSEGEKNKEKQKDNSPHLSKQISKFLRKHFYGGNGRSSISRDDHQKIQTDINQTNNILDGAKNVELFNIILDANKEKPTIGQLAAKAGEILSHENAMWDQGVNPDEFKERYEKVQNNLTAADHHNRKRVTSRDTNAYLSEWQSDRAELSKLIDKLRQRPEEVQREAAEKLPELVNRAQETLAKLNRIRDWKNKRAKLDQPTKAIFTRNRESVLRCIQDYQAYNQLEIQEINRLPKIYAELDYSTRNLSKFVDIFGETSSNSNLQSSDRLQSSIEVVEASISHTSSASGSKSPTRGSLEHLLQRIPQLQIDNYHNERDLADAIYEYYAVDTQQEGFTKGIETIAFKQSLFGISPPEGVSVNQVGGFVNFLNDNGIESDDSYMRRIAINSHPDHIVEVTNELVQEIPRFPCISELKVTYHPREAVERLDNIVIYFSDPPKSDNNGPLGNRVVEICRQYTRLGHPAMMMSIDSQVLGIAFGDQSKSDSFGNSRVDPIAAVVWELKEKGEPITFKTLLPKVEEAYRAHGIDPDDPQWDTK